MSKRFCQVGYLKPEKRAEYIELHAAVWPKVAEMITKCNLHNYSISIMGDMVVSYFEYTGEDYDADMRMMEADPVTQDWWQHTKPCFLHHDQKLYYEDMQEIFYQA